MQGIPAFPLEERTESVELSAVAPPYQLTTMAAPGTCAV